MSTITDIKSVLTQKNFDALCRKFHIPEEVHPQLPTPDQTIHDKPEGKIGIYTRFFDFANYRLPLSSFFVDVLSTKGGSPVCYTKPIDSLKNWNNRFFWVDSFACPALFRWHTNKSVPKDPPPKPTDFNAEHYATLVAQKSALMDLSAFINVADPTLVKVVKRERVEGEAKLLETIVGHTVPLLPVALVRSEASLEDSVNRLFDEGGSGNQVDSAIGIDQNIVVEPEVEHVAAETEIVKKVTRHHKKRPVAADASGSNHPPKKLREDYGTSGGKSPSVIRKLLASSILNAEVGVAAPIHHFAPLFPFSVSATHEKAGDDFAVDVYWEPNSETLVPPEVESIPRSVDPPIMIEAVVTTEAAGVSSHLFPKTVVDTSSRVGLEALHETFVPRWNVPNDTLLDEHDIYREFIDHLAPPVLFSQIRNIDYHHLFTEFNVGTARQACLNAEVRMRIEFCLSKRTRLEVEYGRQASLLKSKDEEIEVLKAQLTVKEAEAADAIRLRTQIVAMERAHTDEVMELQSSLSAKDLEAKELAATVAIIKSQNDSLVDQVNVLEGACSKLREQVFAYESLKEQIEEFQDEHMRVMFDKLAKLEVDLIGCSILPCYKKWNEVGIAAEIENGENGVERIRRNIVEHRSALAGVFAPLVEPFSVQSLAGAANTSDAAPSVLLLTLLYLQKFALASYYSAVCVVEYVEGCGQ
ncbi:hypothetical protein Tco_0236672 [Tanacetum coccineum]